MRCTVHAVSDLGESLAQPSILGSGAVRLFPAERYRLQRHLTAPVSVAGRGWPSVDRITLMQ